jgi:hypothetical protein
MGNTKEVNCHKSAHETRFAREARNNEVGLVRRSCKA